MRSERFHFPGHDGQQLAATLDLPDQTPSAYALLAHCFTCGQNVLAARHIAAALADHGIAVLRFDFTGIGASEGEFANTGFASNVDDLVAAADHLRAVHGAPAILIGHSLGGTACLAAAARIPDARAVVTIGAPSDPSHVAGLLEAQADTIRRDGEAEVVLAGRAFRIKRAFLDEVAEHNLPPTLARLRKALLILHAPADAIVGIDNATRIFVAARHPKSFVSLAGVDHLVSEGKDAAYIGGVIAAWVTRYLDASAEAAAAAASDDAAPRRVVVQETGVSAYQQRITVGPHHLLADEPLAAGGADSGPTPYDLLLSGLGACTAMTMRMYAARKKLPLAHVTVTLTHRKIHAADCAECETRTGLLDHIERVIAIEGDLDAGERKKLMEIADKCPVHRTLQSKIHIVTRTADGAA